MKNKDWLNFRIIVPIVVGIVIILGVLLAFFEIERYQNENIMSNKEQSKQIIENMINRREGRIETIASSIIAFYEGSQQVERDEFFALISFIK
jgi:predicted negative regulator of RcsB-dependent stress response